MANDAGTSVSLSCYRDHCIITYAAFVAPAKFEIVQVPKYVMLEIAFGLNHYGLIGPAFFALFKRAIQPG